MKIFRHLPLLCWRSFVATEYTFTVLAVTVLAATERSRSAAYRRFFANCLLPAIFVMLSVVEAFPQSLTNTAHIKNDAGVYIVCPQHFTNNINGNIQNDGNIYVGGNFINNSAFNSGNASNVKLNGTTQDIGGTSSPLFNNLIIDGSDNKTISIHTSIADSLVFNANKVVVTNQNLILLPNATIAGADNSRFIVTNGIGNVVKKSLPVSANFLFPVGDAINSYKPAIINYTGTIDTFTVRVETGVSPTTGVDATCVQNTWVIEESNTGSTNATLNLGWNSTDEGSSFVNSITTIWQNNSGAWTSIAGTPGSISNTPATEWYHEATGIIDFSNVSNRFILKTFPPPIIIKQPVNDTTCAEGLLNFNITAAAMGTIIYQWQENCGSGWNNITDDAVYSGTTSNNLDILNATTSNNLCQYQCIVSNESGAVVTDSATAIVNPIFLIHESVEICYGDTFEFNGNSYTTEGTYYDTLVSVNGCDSVIETSLIVHSVYSISNPQTICSGNTYVYNGNTYTETGTYYDTLISITGCDSIIVTELTVNPVYSINNLQTICNGGSYNFNGNSYTTEGIYYDTLVSINGCDSVIITELTVYPVYSISNPQTICNGSSYTINGNSYTTEGIYYDTLASINSCDSVIITELTVFPVYSISNPQTICNGSSYTINGNSYTTAGIYYDTLTTVNGCDSIIITALTVDSLSSEPTIIIASQNPVCSGTQINLSVADGSLGTGATWIWYEGNCGSSQTGTGNNIPVTPTVTTTYYVRAEGICNNTNCIDITINVNQNLPVSISISTSDNTICSGTEATFFANTINGGLNPTYQWIINGAPVLNANDSVFSSSTLSNNDTISCSVISSEACAVPQNEVTSNTLSIQVTQIVSPVINITSNPVFPICQGTSVGFLANPINGGFNPSFQWYVNNVYSGSGVNFTPNGLSNNDQIFCILNSTLACVSSSTAQSNLVLATINPFPLVAVSLQKESCYGAGDASISLNITQGKPPYSIFWDNVTGQNNLETLSNLGSGTYNVTVTDNESCSIDTSIFISQEGTGCLFIPNVFSPNNDGKNDVLYVRGGNIQSLIFNIYDRWGNKIFETNNQNFGWDGTYNGNPLNAGVFVYYLKAELYNGNNIEDQGNITLLK